MLKWQNNAKHNINQPTDFHRFPLQHGWPGQPAQRASKTGSGRAHVALMSGEEGPTCNQHLIVFCCCRKLTRKQTRKPGVCTPHCSEKWGIGISNACFLEVLRGTMWNPKWSMGGHPCPFLLYGSKFICYLQWGSPCNDLQVRVLESGHDPHVGWLILKPRILCRMLSLHKCPRSPPFSDHFGWLSSVLLCQRCS